MRRVGIPSPEVTMIDYPHKMSGGMRQRVMIAMAIACNPGLIIADEPTTALDVTIQAQILSLLDDLRETHGMSILLITHDLGVIAEMAEQVLVMYTGRIVEHASVKELFENPLHPYTQGLMQSIPSRGIGIGRDRLKPIRRSRSQSVGTAARVQIQYKVPLVFRSLLSGGTGAPRRRREATRCAAGFIRGVVLASTIGASEN